MELDLQSMQCGIRSDFLSPNSYKITLEFAQKRYENYLRFCKLIERYYGDLQAMSRIVGEKLKTPVANGLQTILQFKKFIIDFMSIIQEVSTFKISYYAQLKDVEEDPVKKPTYELLAIVNKYSQKQNEYKILNDKIRKLQDNIQNSYIQLKKETKDPVVYFDHKYTKTKCIQIEEFIKNRQQLQRQGNLLLEAIYQNTNEFEREIMFYRQKMLSGKYKIYKKLGQMAKGARQCLVETLLSLLESVNQKVQAFRKLQRESQKQNTLHQKFKNRSKHSINSSQNVGDLNTIEIIIQATQQYNALINDLEIILKLLTESFSVVGANTKQFQESSMSIVQELNKLYQNDQNPTPDIIETLQLFNYFCNKLSDIPNRIHIHEANLAKLRQNITKHSQITLSLVRCGGNKMRGQGKGLDQISHLFEQLSYDYLNDIIQKLYKEFQDCLGNIKNHFNAKFYKKRKNMVEDSMEISHIEQQTPIRHKKPSKKEQWIWKDFRNLEKYHQLSDYSTMKQQIAKFIKCFTDMKNQEEKQIEKYSCNLKVKKQAKGTLRILQKCLEFTSSNNQINMKIPYDYIQQVVAGVNIFEKELNVKTSIDNVTFLHFPQISRAEVLIQQQIASHSSTKKIQKKLSVEVTDQQKKFLAQRRQKIESQRQSIQGMQEIGSALLEDTTVDSVYYVIYSDKPFKNRGKQQLTFMGFALKKGGGSNYTTTPYTPAGPKFYSLQEGNTFINSPLFSERTNTYEVPLPPIPFMPKFCSNVQQVKIFWISNQQFDYVIRSNSSGAPGADSFYISFVHRIVQKDKNVEIKIYFKITFIKDTSLKGMITSKSEEQSKENVQILLKQAKRVMKSMGGAANTEEGKVQNQQKQQEQESMSKSRGSGKVKKLQNQNKILIGVLVGVILLNLILRFF